MIIRNKLLESLKRFFKARKTNDIDNLLRPPLPPPP